MLGRLKSKNDKDESQDIVSSRPQYTIESESRTATPKTESAIVSTKTSESASEKNNPPHCIQWKYDEDRMTLYFRGTGPMINFKSDEDGLTTAPWAEMEIRQVDFYDGITHIGNCAFLGKKGIKSVTLPDTLESIGKKAFYGCIDLETVELPIGIQIIDDDSFGKTESLNYVDIPIGVKHIGAGAFANSGIVEISLPNSLMTIGAGAFASSKLNNAELPEQITRIEADTFKSCTNLSGVRFAGPVEYIGERAFAYCPILKDVTLPSSLKTISEDGFRGCPTLTTIILPETLQYIGDYAFKDCTSLSIKIPYNTSVGVGTTDGVAHSKISYNSGWNDLVTDEAPVEDFELVKSGKSIYTLGIVYEDETSSKLFTTMIPKDGKVFYKSETQRFFFMNESNIINLECYYMDMNGQKTPMKNPYGLKLLGKFKLKFATVPKKGTPFYVTFNLSEDELYCAYTYNGKTETTPLIFETRQN